MCDRSEKLFSRSKTLQLAKTPALRASVSGLRPCKFFFRYAPPNDRKRFYLVANLILFGQRSFLKVECTCKLGQRLRSENSGPAGLRFFFQYAPPNDRQRFYLVENLLSRSKTAVKAESSCNWSSLGQGRNLLAEIEGTGTIVFGRKAFVKVENLAIGRIGRHSGPAGLR